MPENCPPAPAPPRDHVHHGAAPSPEPGPRRSPRTADPTVPFTQTVDGRLGTVRPRGHLTAETGALLRETVEALHRSGHTRVRLDLGGLVSADDAGLDALSSLQRWVTARGRSLVLVGRLGQVTT